MEDIKVQLLSMWLAFTEAIIRFFNNRAIKIDEQVSYLRLQLEIEKQQNKELIEVIKNYVIGSENEEQTNQNQTEHKPIGYKEPWHITRQKLESKSRKEALELDREARIAVERNKSVGKSIEELEEELLNGSD